MRNGALDYCRFIAALGIVWFHTNAPGHRIAYLALPFFIVLLSLPSKSTMKQRAHRLLVPFLVWSAIYAAVRASVAVSQGEHIFGWWQANMVLVGTSFHLWFLPFAFIVSLCVPMLRNSKLALCMPVLAALLLTLLGQSQPPPFAQWAFGLVPALFGVAYFKAGRIAILSLLASVAVLMALRPSPDNITILVGCALAAVALSLLRKPSAFSDWCNRLSVWIFLGHVLVLMVGYSFRLDGFALAIFCLVGSVLLAAFIDLGLTRVKQTVWPSPLADDLLE